jgi:hypothetical protein
MWGDALSLLDTPAALLAPKVFVGSRETGKCQLQDTMGSR